MLRLVILPLSSSSILSFFFPHLFSSRLPLFSVCGLFSSSSSFLFSSHAVSVLIMLPTGTHAWKWYGLSPSSLSFSCILSSFFFSLFFALFFLRLVLSSTRPSCSLSVSLSSLRRFSALWEPKTTARSKDRRSS